MKTISWKEQLENSLHQDGDERDDVFGTNIEWDVKYVRRYIEKLEKLGAYDIEVPDHDTIQFRLPSPTVSGELLLFVLTSYPMPNEVNFIKSKHPRGRMLQLSWDY